MLPWLYFRQGSDFSFNDFPNSGGERSGHIFGYATKTKINFVIYAGAIAEYMRRKITHAEDILKAITRVLSALNFSFQSTYLFGLPKTQLDQALL